VTRIALIHATPLAMGPIAQAFVQHWPQADTMHVLDDTLSKDLARQGSLDDRMVQRFVDLALYAQRQGAHGLLFTCSAFGPAIDATQRATSLPTLKPNEAMFEEALAGYREGTPWRVGLVATFEATIPALTQEFEALVLARGLKVSVHSELAQGAMDDLAQGKTDVHHHKVVQALKALPPVDVVMLAQFSMAAALPLAQAAVACPVLSSPDCATLLMQQRLSAPPAHG
jgi:hypothetical protein